MTQTASSRRPWIAAALSVLLPGLGHAYLREWLRMAMWLTLMGAIVLFMIPPDMLPEEMTVDALMTASRNLPTDLSITIALLRVLNVADAYMVGRMAERRAAIAAGQQCTHCGHELDDPDLTFCPWCGADLNDDVTQPTDSTFEQ